MSWASEESEMGHASIVARIRAFGNKVTGRLSESLVEDALEYIDHGEIAVAIMSLAAHLRVSGCYPDTRRTGRALQSRHTVRLLPPHPTVS